MSDKSAQRESRHMKRWLAELDESVVVVEDFVPAQRSLAWRMGQAYWHLKGVQAFTTNAVPNIVTNDGYLATRTAETFFANCMAAHEQGRLEDEVKAVEMAVGIGMHARIFLSRLAELCEENEFPLLDRLVFYATDISRSTLESLRDSDTLRVPGVKIRLGFVDATEPTTFADLETGEEEPLSGVRLLRSNYLLCVLPFHLLMRRDDAWSEMYVRTRVADTKSLRQVYGDRIDEILDTAKRGDDEAIEALAPEEHLFSTERIYVPIARDDLPFASAVEAYFDEALARNAGESGICRTLVSLGALRSVDKGLEILVDDGFMIHSDYGWSNLRMSSEIGHFQYFGGSTAIGLNFPLVEHFVECSRDEPGRAVAAPNDSQSPIQTRLFARRELPETEETFTALFEGDSYKKYWEGLNELGNYDEKTDPEVVMERFELAHAANPFNWRILGQWSGSATFFAKDPRRGLDLAMKGLQICPSASGSLWNEYGDALYALERYEEAHRAFLRSREIDPEEPRTRLSLGWSHSALWQVDEAVDSLCEGIKLDVYNAYGDRFMEKLKSVMEQRELVENNKQHYRSSRTY